MTTQPGTGLPTDVTDQPADSRPHLVIVGGGFAGASAAVQVMRRSPRPLRVTLFEPRAELGRGLAYRSPDPDHRINSHLAFHPIDPGDIAHVMRWAQAESLLERDPEAACEFGVFPRRADYGRYLHESVLEHQRGNPSGSVFSHDRRRVAGYQFAAHGAGAALSNNSRLAVSLDGGEVIAADALIIATGNPIGRVPKVLRPVADLSAVVTSPLEANALDVLDSERPVAVMGTSLTAADTLASLIRRGHRQILAFSRRGLRPRAQKPPDPTVSIDDLPNDWLVSHFERESPEYCRPGRADFTIRGLTRNLRRQIARVAEEGQPWQVAFDDLRDAVWKFWPHLPDAEKRRFMRHVRPWYDVHRFRIPPQTDVLIDEALAQGRLSFGRYALRAVRADGDSQLRLTLSGRDGERSLLVSGLVNCTGFDLAAGPSAGSFEHNLVASGLLSAHPTGLGYRVDDACRPIDKAGLAQESVRFVGPGTVGHFGDPLGAIFIEMQIHRMLPGLFSMLA